MATEALPAGDGADDDALVDLVPMLRRVVGARVKDPHTVDDLVQETLVRVMAARSRVEPAKLPHYASVTARNLVASMAEKNDRTRSRTHLLLERGRESPRTPMCCGRRSERSSVPRWPSCRAAIETCCSRMRWMARTPTRWRPDEGLRQGRWPPD